MTSGEDAPEVPTASVVLKKGRLKPVYAGHPWIFSGAIQNLRGEPDAGDLVWVLNPSEEVIGWGLYSPSSKLRIRFWGSDTSSEQARFSPQFRNRIEAAQKRRISMGLPSDGTTAYRLINGEGDRVPGCTVDVVGSALAVRYGSTGLWRRRAKIANILREIMDCSQIAQIVDPQVALAEEIYGITHISGEPDLEKCPVEFQEEGLYFETDLLSAQKSGHYSDQRENRLLVRKLAKGRRVLDLCTYTGGFGLNAAMGGAESVTAVDSSAPALKLARRNAAKNGMENISFVHEDIMRVMNGHKDGSFDLVILDPPKLIKSRNHQGQGEKKYRSLNARALRMLAPEGLFLSFSCSGVFEQQSFHRMLSLAAQSAEKTLHVHANLGAGPDHPFVVQAPESNYLKGILGSVASR